MKRTNNGKNHSEKTYSMMGLVWYRFRKNKLAMFGMCILILMALLVLIGPFFIDEGKVIDQNMAERFLSPSMTHWFGTDQYGRDLFARIVYGGRISFFAGLLTIGIAFVCGCILGGIAGYMGGIVDDIIMRIVDIFMAIPALLMSMAIVTALGQGVFKMLIALSIAQIPRFTRFVRSSVLSLRNQDFIEAARCYGTSSWKIILSHILPNGLGPVLVTATLGLGSTILSIASLGFLGIGIAAPTPEWGTILSENRAFIRYYPYIGLIPGIFIAISVMAFNFMGDGLRDAFDPRTKN